MIKFFRHIRKRLLTENKPLKYARYAIGEILLVVIGILIALSINNWNEGRKDNLKEQAILNQLQEEYTANLKQLEAKMQMRSTVVKSGLSVLKYMNTPKFVPRDSVILQLGYINNDATFDPIKNDLISSGNIRLIRNEKLRRLLSSWSSDVMAVQEQEGMTQMMVHQIMRPLFHDIGITRDMQDIGWKDSDASTSWMLDEQTDNPTLVFGKSLNSISAQEILTNKKLEGVVSSAININFMGNLESQSLKKRIIEILELIKIELNK